MTSEAHPAVQLLGVSGSYNCPPMHSSSVVCLEGLTVMQKKALHSNVVARMLADVLGTCGAQMKLGANDTGRLFNWHPVRFACATLFLSVYLCGLLRAAQRCPLSNCSVRQVLMALAFPVFMAEVTALSRHCVCTVCSRMSVWSMAKIKTSCTLLAALAAVLCAWIYRFNLLSP